MSKRKPLHPTLKSLRQGQTVYVIKDESLLKNDGGKYVEKYFLHSHKIPEPPIGCIVEKLSVEKLKRGIRIQRKNSFNWIYYSRRKAEAACHSR